MILTNGFTEVCFGYKQTKDIILLSRKNARINFILLEDNSEKRLSFLSSCI